MLQCEYCDYYKKLQNSSGAIGKDESLCEFTGYVFTEDVNEQNIGYPCSSVSYQSYLEKKKNTEVVLPLNEDWKFKFKKYHVKPASKKEKISA